MLSTLTLTGTLGTDGARHEGRPCRPSQQIGHPSARRRVPGPAGADTVFTVERQGSSVRIGRSGDPLPWHVRSGDEVTDLGADQDSCTLTLG